MLGSSRGVCYSTRLLDHDLTVWRLAEFEELHLRAVWTSHSLRSNMESLGKLTMLSFREHMRQNSPHRQQLLALLGWDADPSRAISEAEFAKGVKGVGFDAPTKVSVMLVFSQLRAGKSGNISFSDLAKLLDRSPVVGGLAIGGSDGADSGSNGVGEIGTAAGANGADGAQLSSSRSMPRLMFRESGVYLFEGMRPKGVNPLAYLSRLVQGDGSSYSPLLDPSTAEAAASSDLLSPTRDERGGTHAPHYASEVVRARMLARGELPTDPWALPKRPPSSIAANGAPTTNLPATPPKPSMSERELREKLQPIFNKFDEDGSGAVSTAEMTKIVKQLKLQMTPKQLAGMMKEADPDGSGEIDFEEFVAVLKVQMEKGGQLASVMSEASSVFGFLNPMNWFASAPAAAAPPPPPPPAPALLPMAVPTSPAAASAAALRTTPSVTPQLKATRKAVETHNGSLEVEKAASIARQEHAALKATVAHEKAAYFADVRKADAAAREQAAKVKPKPRVPADPAEGVSMQHKPGADGVSMILTQSPASKPHAGAKSSGRPDVSHGGSGFGVSVSAPKPEETMGGAREQQQQQSPAPPSTLPRSNTMEARAVFTEHKKQRGSRISLRDRELREKAKAIADERELRRKLRPIFNKFDIDRSGAVSMNEMRRMLKSISLDLDAEALSQLMNDADTDGSGDIDFEEFVVALQKHIAGGGSSDLASVVNQAGSAFGWLPWFGGAPAPPPKNELAGGMPPRPQRQTPSRPVDLGNIWASPTKSYTPPHMRKPWQLVKAGATSGPSSTGYIPEKKSES